MQFLIFQTIIYHNVYHCESTESNVGSFFANSETTFPQLGTKKNLKKNFGLLSFGNCCMVPKNVKGGLLGFITIHCVAKYPKT